MRRLALLLPLVAALAGGCGGSHRRLVTAGTAVRDARAARRQWLAALHANARINTDGPHFFPAPPTAVFDRRLRAVARRDRLRIESVVWRHGVQPAPDVVLESNDDTGTVRALPRILKAIHERAYEGIFLEVVDTRHVPYVAVFDALRGHVQGGQWARADGLFPFAHG